MEFVNRGGELEGSHRHHRQVAQKAEQQSSSVCIMSLLCRIRMQRNGCTAQVTGAGSRSTGEGSPAPQYVIVPGLVGSSLGGGR
jgi:hypothetical protein